MLNDREEHYWGSNLAKVWLAAPNMQIKPYKGNQRFRGRIRKLQNLNYSKAEYMAMT